MEFIERVKPKHGWTLSCVDIKEEPLLIEWQQIARPGKTFKFHKQQHVGCGYDCFIAKERVEIKNDMASKIWGNAFVETQQTFDGKRTWVWSGISLSLIAAAKHFCDTFVMAVYALVPNRDKTIDPSTSWFLWATPKEWQAWARTGTPKDTMRGANGNPTTSFGRGYAVPVQRLLKGNIDE